MTTVFAMSGGGNLGAVQVGMLLALTEAGIRPDVIVGTSVGAINGAWLSSHGYDSETKLLRSLDGLVEIWVGMERADVFPFHARRGVAALLGRADHCVPNSGLRDLLTEHVTFDRLEDAPVPFHVVAADLLRGCAVRLSEGPAVESILASAAIPGIFPPVEIDGRELVDGGIIEGTPIAQSVELGATTVWALPTGYSCGLQSAPAGALAMVFHAVGVLAAQQLERDIIIHRDRVELHVVPPPCPIHVWAHDFSQSAELIDRSYVQTKNWLGMQAAQRPIIGRTACPRQ